jgi:hypothetical protein
MKAERIASSRADISCQPTCLFAGLAGIDEAENEI